MIHIIHRRLFSNPFETIGIWYLMAGNAEVFLCMILEDEYRSQKVFSETRIPAGIYEIKLRTEGSHHIRYQRKFPDMHKGMLHIINVPKFKWILFHIGNDEDDTAGCQLPGMYFTTKVVDGVDRFKVIQSTYAYKRVYPIIANRIENSSQTTHTNKRMMIGIAKSAKDLYK